jgi:hypothetical protein
VGPTVGERPVSESGQVGVDFLVWVDTGGSIAHVWMAAYAREADAGLLRGYRLQPSWQYAMGHGNSLYFAILQNRHTARIRGLKHIPMNCS